MIFSYWVGFFNFAVVVWNKNTFFMKCLHFSLLWKSPTFLVEIRGGAISKGNGEGDSLRGLLQEFLLKFVLFWLLHEFLSSLIFILGMAKKCTWLVLSVSKDQSKTPLDIWDSSWLPGFISLWSSPQGCYDIGGECVPTLRKQWEE